MGGGQLYSTKSRPLILYVVVFFSTLICFIFDFLITISFFFFFFSFLFFSVSLPSVTEIEYNIIILEL